MRFDDGGSRRGAEVEKNGTGGATTEAVRSGGRCRRLFPPPSPRAERDILLRSSAPLREKPSTCARAS